MTGMDEVFYAIVRGGGISGVLIAFALLYLAMQVKGLERAVDGVRDTLGEKVFPTLDTHTAQINELLGKYDMWQTMRRDRE